MDQTVRLWNVSDPTHPTLLGTPLTSHTRTVNAVAFSPDGHTLATGSSEETVRLWNIPDALLLGHTNRVRSVTFSRDGHTLATGSNDGTVQLWNVSDPTQPTPLGTPLTGHTKYVYAVAFSPNRYILATVSAVAFSPDGRTLATGSDDQTIRLWEMNVDQAIQRICATTTNTLTSAKWRQYVSPDLPCHSHVRDKSRLSTLLGGDQRTADLPSGIGVS